MTPATPPRAPASSWLAWLTLCGLLGGLTLGQLLGGHLHGLWWAWALTPPAALAAAEITRQRRGSRLFAAGVMLTLGWTGGGLLYGLIAVAVSVMMRRATN